MISWALQVVFTLGIGLVWVVPQVIAAVAKTAAKIADITGRLVKALKALIPLLKKAGDLFSHAAKALKNIKPGKGAPNPKLSDLPSGPKGTGTPHGGNGSGGSAPPPGGGRGRPAATAPRHPPRRAPDQTAPQHHPAPAGTAMDPPAHPEARTPHPHP